MKQIQFVVRGGLELGISKFQVRRKTRGQSAERPNKNAYEKNNYQPPSTENLETDEKISGDFSKNLEIDRPPHKTMKLNLSPPPLINIHQVHRQFTRSKGEKSVMMT